MEESNEIRDICQQLLNRYKTAITDSGHMASGELANSATVLTRFDGKYFEIYFNLEDYWKYLENGRKPGSKFPPIDKIEKWIRIKPIIPSTRSGKIPTTKQLAFLIARGIAKNGIKPTKLLQNTIDKSDDLLDLIVEELANLITEEEINEQEIL